MDSGYSIYKFLPDGRVSWVAGGLDGTGPRDVFTRYANGMLIRCGRPLRTSFEIGATYLVVDPKSNPDLHRECVFKAERPVQPLLEITPVNLAA